MKHLKTINELHQDTYISARDKTAKYLGDDSDMVKKYDKHIDGEYMELSDDKKELYRNARKNFRKDPNGASNWRENVRTVDTFLPVFSGFYGTFFDGESEEESEIEHINDERESKGLEPIEYGDIEWDYETYREEYAKNITNTIDNRLGEEGFDVSIKYQELVSPKSYNYSNDSINIELTFNPIQVKEYLLDNVDEFDEYLKEHYTSRSGFYSSHSNNVDEWLSIFDKDEHKIGAIFDFILRNEDFDESELYDETERVSSIVKNYDELIGEE